MEWRLMQTNRSPMLPGTIQGSSQGRTRTFKKMLLRVSLPIFLLVSHLRFSGITVLPTVCLLLVSHLRFYNITGLPTVQRFPPLLLLSVWRRCRGWRHSADGRTPQTHWGAFDTILMECWREREAVNEHQKLTGEQMWQLMGNGSKKRKWKG